MNADISKLLQLEHNCKSCQNLSSLHYIIVNETRELVDYEQAAILGYKFGSTFSVLALSDMSTLDSTSLHITFLEKLTNHLVKMYPENQKPYVVDIAKDLTKSLLEDLMEYSPPNILWLPLKIFRNNVEIEYHLVLFKIKKFDQKEIEVLEYVASSYKYFLFAMRECSFTSKLTFLKYKRKYFLATLVFIAGAMFYPVKMNVVAPFEVEAQNPYIVTSGIDGVVEKVLIEPNQKISKNTLLVKLEDIDHQNNVEIAKKKLEAAQAELYSVKQASFYEREKLSHVPTLQKDILLKESELNFALDQLAKTKIYSSKDGIAIIDNPISFKGKPIATGEKIMMIADGNDLQIKIMVPVNDALFLQESAEINLTFDNRVLQVWDAKVRNISYNPQLTPENILSYRVTADFADITQYQDKIQIGLRGTAKIYSQEVTLFFYLFRKPITSLRQSGIW